MDLGLLSVTPYIAKLKAATGRQGYLCPFAVNAVADLYARQRYEVVHLTMLCHLDPALAAPDCTG